MPPSTAKPVDLRRARRGSNVEVLAARRGCPRAARRELAPTSADVTRGSRSVQAIAICARRLAAPRAISFSARTWARFSSVRSSVSERALARRARAGRDAVEVAVGQQALRERREGDAADAAPRPGRRAGSASIQRLSIEYDGWWMSSGVPRSAQDRGRLARALRRVARRCRRRAPCPAGRRCPARPSSPRAACRGRSGASRRCRRSRGPSAAGSGRGWPAGTCASPIRRTARATCRSRPWSR